MKTRPEYAEREPRHVEVANRIRQRITSGVLRPGAALPTHRDMLKEFGVGDSTIRLAVATLVADGFLTSTKRKGTFVTVNPPNLSHIGVVFPHSLHARASWSPFYAALANEAEALARATPYHTTLYDRTEPLADEEESPLVHDIKAGKFAGLLFASPPYSLQGSRLFDNPRIARIAIMARQQLAQFPSIVWFDYQSFTEKAVEFLVSSGRRHIAMLTTHAPEPPDSYADHFRASLARRGLDIPAYWIQHSSTDVRNLIHLLAHPGQTRRPDALIITDDTLSEQALAGLIAAGVRVPDDMLIVTHANFPLVAPSILPVTRLGYDVRRVFRTCVELIDAQRRGESIPMVTRIPAVFEV